MEVKINNNVKKEKLHTSELAVSSGSCDFDQLLPALIQINEFLPRKKLGICRLARQRARLLGSGSTSLARRGQIYVRRNKGD